MKINPKVYGLEGWKNMPNKSKQKGNRFEREVVRICKEKGIRSKRAWGSNGMSLGMHEEVDLTINDYKIQAKVRNKIAKFLIPTEHVDAVVYKEDRGEILIMLRLNDFLEIIT